MGQGQQVGHREFPGIGNSFYHLPVNGTMGLACALCSVFISIADSWQCLSTEGRERAEGRGSGWRLVVWCAIYTVLYVYI
jgi:hypothetical protein